MGEFSSDKWKFLTTRWELVEHVQAGDADSEARRAALSEICDMYWFPLYAYVRRSGKSPADSEDLIQGFFLHLLEENSIARADPEKGKLRTFLLCLLKRYMVSEYRKEQAQKRGGGMVIVSIDQEAAEERYRLEPSHDITPDILYDRQWMRELLDRAKEALRYDYARRGKAHRFESLEAHLTPGDSEKPYAKIAEETDSSEGAVKMAVRRMRKHYMEIIREQIASTVSTAEDVEREWNELIAAFSS